MILHRRPNSNGKYDEAQVKLKRNWYEIRVEIKSKMILDSGHTELERDNVSFRENMRSKWDVDEAQTKLRERWYQAETGLAWGSVSDLK
jgi:hypothetical protein